MTTTNPGASAPEAPETIAADTWVSIADAALLCGVSRDTIKRDLEKRVYGKKAIQEESGRREWLIQVQGLVDAHRLAQSRVAERVTDLKALKESRVIAELRVELADLQLRIAVLTEQVTAAMTQAETDRQRADTAERREQRTVKRAEQAEDSLHTLTAALAGTIAASHLVAVA
jgi:hypothetical protein